MKKLFAILLALCLFASLLPMTVMAEDPAVSVQFRNTVTGFSGFTYTLNPGETKYLTTNDQLAFVKWTETEAPTDKFIKLDYPADGKATLKVTFNNINSDSSTSGYVADSIDFLDGAYAVEIELVGTNVMTQKNSAVIESRATKGMTITGSGSLEVNITGGVHGSIINRGGDLVVKNTNLKFNVNPGNSSLHHAFFAPAPSRNVIIEGTKIESVTMGGRVVYMGTNDAKIGRYTLDTDETRSITIKNSEITAKAEKAIFTSAAPVNIENSTLKLTASNAGIFSKAPNFVGEYTAIAGLAKNADKLDKLKVFDEKKLSSYTYIYIVPGIQDLLPTEPETTVPEITEPEETIPQITTPETLPQITTPETTPNVTTPETQPAETKPVETTPNATEPAGTDAEEGGSPLKVVLIIMIVVLVAAGAAFGVLVYLKKKKGN